MITSFVLVRMDCALDDERHVVPVVGPLPFVAHGFDVRLQVAAVCTVVVVRKAEPGTPDQPCVPEDSNAVEVDAEGDGDLAVVPAGAVEPDGVATSSVGVDPGLGGAVPRRCHVGSQYEQTAGGGDSTDLGGSRKRGTPRYEQWSFLVIHSGSSSHLTGPPVLRLSRSRSLPR